MQQQQQQQQQQQPSQQPEILYGIPLNGIDEETKKLIQQVMRIATTILFVYYIGLIIDLLTGSISFFNFLLGLIAAALVPMCGYFGAKNRDVGLLNSFTASNGCCACWQVFTLLTAYAYLGTREEHCKECLRTADSEYMRNTSYVSEEFCKDITEESDCNYTGGFVWVTFNCIVMFILYLYACKLSQKLASRHVFVQHIPRGNNVNTVIMHQQPGTIVQARVVSVSGQTVGYQPNSGPTVISGQPVVYQPNSGPTVISGQTVGYQPNSGATAISGQPVVYQPNSSQPQMVVSQPRAGPNAIYQAHASIPNQQIVNQQINDNNQKTI